MLRYFSSTLTACAIAASISVFAQEPPQQPPPQQPPPQEPANAPESTTLTGCVQQAKTTDGGIAYVLNKVEGSATPMYVLIGPPPAELATHVNHKVEVTGKVQQPAAPPEGTEEPPRDPKVLRPPAIQIESVTMVAETCN